MKKKKNAFGSKQSEILLEAIQSKTFFYSFPNPVNQINRKYHVSRKKKNCEFTFQDYYLKILLFSPFRSHLTLTKQPDKYKTSLLRKNYRIRNWRKPDIKKKLSSSEAWILLIFKTIKKLRRDEKKKRKKK